MSNPFYRTQPCLCGHFESCKYCSPTCVLAAEVVALREDLEAARALAALHAADAKKTLEELAEAERMVAAKVAVARDECVWSDPRYSTEAVDALLRLDADPRHRGTAEERLAVEEEFGAAIEAVRASREPKL